MTFYFTWGTFHRTPSFTKGGNLLNSLQFIINGKEDLKSLEGNFLVFWNSMLKSPLIQILISGWIDLKKHANFCRDCIYFALIRFTRSRGNEYTNTLNNIHI